MNKFALKNMKKPEINFSPTGYNLSYALFSYIAMVQNVRYTLNKKFSSFKRMHFIDAKISRFNKMPFGTTKPMRNHENLTF